MRRFFDTNVLLYAYDRVDARKREAARALIAEATEAEEFVVSAQVLAEFYSNAVRRKVMGKAQARDLVRLWSEHHAVPNTADLLLRGISLHQDHSLEFWDALVVEAAREARCDVLLSEDFQHGRRFGELEIVNPFLASGAHERTSRYATKARSRKLLRRPVRD